MKGELSIEDESKIFPQGFGNKNRASNGEEVEKRQVKKTIQSVEVKNFSF